MRARAACLALLLAGSVAMAQQGDPAAQARDAGAALDAAAQALLDAEDAQNRVKALTRVIRAHEAGLLTLRAARRGAVARERAIAADLARREEEIAQILGALLTHGRMIEPAQGLRPSGPVAMARAGMLLPEVGPALEARAGGLRATLREVAALRALRDEAAETRAAGRRSAQAAREELGTAIAMRRGLPRRFTEDPIEAALLAASVGTLTEFIDGLGGVAVDEVPGSLPDISPRKGSLPLPARGMVSRRAGAADAAKASPPALVVDTLPRALVTTPVPATLRYRGPLLDYGNVIILEPQSGILMIFAGLDTLYGRPGEVLPGGSPVGLMGDASGDGASPGTAADEGGAGRGRMLYIETRERNSPVDPLAWFATDKEG